MMKMKDMLSGWIAVCAACIFLAASSAQASNKPTREAPAVIVGVRGIVDDVDSAIEAYTKLTELASIHYVSDGARATVGFYATALGLADPTAVPIGITPGRARALVGVGVALISLLVGWLALARSGGRTGAGNGRVWAIVAMLLGLIGMTLGVVHLVTSTGGFGTGSGRAGAMVALVLALIGMSLGGLALARSRRSRRIA